MIRAPLVIWCNTLFTPATADAKQRLRDGAGEHRLVFADAGEASLSEADVAFGQPDADEAMRSERLRWVHLNSAGYTAYDRDDVRAEFRSRGCVLTNSSAVYTEPCAQHLLAMIAAQSRRLPAALDAQRGDREWRMAALRSEMRLLGGQNVLILGFGSIARRLCELLAPLRMNLVGVRRRVRGDEPVPMIQESQLDEHLPRADHVVNILPDNADTKRFFDERRLRSLKAGAVFYNIGRGTTVDQDALAELLRSERIGAAYLDVTDPEPLPADHPLWTTPNCFITPHTAGGHADEKMRQVEHFLDNLRRFERGAELTDQVF